MKRGKRRRNSSAGHPTAKRGPILLLETPQFSPCPFQLRHRPVALLGGACAQGSELYPRFRERIQGLAAHAGHIGWGYGDALRDQVYHLESELVGD
jgi:hypothetical protein